MKNESLISLDVSMAGYEGVDQSGSARTMVGWMRCEDREEMNEEKIGGVEMTITKKIKSRME